MLAATRPALHIWKLLKQQWARKEKTAREQDPEISSHGTWSPYMDGIVGTPKSVAEIVSTDEMIDAVLYGLSRFSNKNIR
uniref:Uncharacterized protein n=1 Tax=Salix viminalis TaxID=40686 RepID=A0A6N2LYW9_SALVM